MRISGIGLVMLVFVLGTAPGAVVQTEAQASARSGVPYPTAETPRAVDLGPMTAQPEGSAPISITVVLGLRNLSEAEELMVAFSTPGNAQYHQFLSSEQFVERFAPTDADVVGAIAGLARYGLVAERATATTLRVTGMPADMERAFGVSLHTYSVAAHESVPGYSYHAPLNSVTLPPELTGRVSGVFGLDTHPSFRPLSQTAPSNLKMARLVSQTNTPDAPGNWTVIDFADYYDVQPLYRDSVSGNGRTLGIVTFASFTPSDAFAYWSALGLSVNPRRLQIVNVDGGPGAPSDLSGSGETTGDVELSGGIAPGANIILYQAPNTNQGFVDAFASVVDANSAETLSVSWGQWEVWNDVENAPVDDPTTGRIVGLTQATHELFVRAAVQGQTLFAASGDGGAYLVNWLAGCFGPYSPAQPDSCSQPLSVEYPASDTAITAGGGTTLPVLQEFCLNAACTPPLYDVNIPHERVWGWDYLDGYCNALGYSSPSACGVFPAGSTGGVSILFEQPSYQFLLPGTQVSQPGQVWEAGTAVAAEQLSEDDCILNCSHYALPAYFPGRNVPDISFNADPLTGYVLYYTSQPSGVFSILSGGGGTSVVAPELNGVSALLGQYLHGRMGLLNPVLYQLGFNGQGYRAPSAFHAIEYGDNWFYRGSEGYNLGVGFGTLDVANFAEFLRDPF